MLSASLLIWYSWRAVSFELDMSFMKRIFKRKSTKRSDPTPLDVSDCENDDTGDDNEVIDAVSSPESSEVCSISDDDKHRIKLKKLLRQKRRLDITLNLKCDMVVAMEAEINQLMTLIARSKHHIQTLNKEIVTKQCEMKFLKSHFPEGCEGEAKKREPLIYKRYSSIKTASDARSLLTNIQQRHRALEHLELLTYNKYLEMLHPIKSSNVKKKHSLLSKDKMRNFGHLVDVMSERDTDSRSLQRSGSEPIQLPNSAENKPLEITHVNVVGRVLPFSPFSTTSQPTSPRSPDSERGSMMTSPPISTTSQTQPLLFPNLIRFPATLTQATETAL